MSHGFAPVLLRDYDLRGTVGRTLHRADAWALGRSFGPIIARRIYRRLENGKEVWKIVRV